MSALRVLLVEDNPLTRKLVRRTLEKTDVQLHEATSAREAMEVFSACQPHVVLQDLVLPDGSGFDVLQKMRAHPLGEKVPILAFTGLMSHEDESHISTAGFDGLITKPVAPSRLLDVVRGHLPAPAKEPAGSGQGKRVLIADDDPQQLKMTRFRLSRLGFVVETATDGVEALAAARRFAPDVILTDALMPNLDGFGLCLEARKDAALAATPIVIATSTYVEAEDRQLAAQAGANAFVVRTADLGNVVQAIRQVLQDSPAPPSGAGPASDPGAIEGVRASRTVRQLERQVSLNAGLAQRCSILSAELVVLSTVAEALVNARDLETALFDILANCLDAAATSRGAIYLTQPDGTLALRASHGLKAVPNVQEKIGAAEARALAAAGQPLVTWADVFPPSLPCALPGAALLPLRAGGVLVGTMVLDRPRTSQTAEDWSSFARAIANQVSLAVTLARSFARIEASEQRSRALMDHAADGILVATADGRIVEANQAAERILGDVEANLVERRLEDLVSSDTIRRPDGTTVSVECTSALVPSGAEPLQIIIVRDVSERNVLSAQLRQAQKVEALGRLAGGVAHDFNNVLSIVLSYSELVLADMAADDARREDVAEIQRAGLRAAEMTQQLLAFSRQRVVQPRVTALGDEVVASKNMLQRILGADVSLEVDVAAASDTVLVDEGQLHQVILNLVVNARDAMPSGGTIRVRVENAEISALEAERSGMGAGHYVVMRVADEGVGMDEDTRAKIFEPFFTTKAPGKGTGLGLATVFGIVEQAHGKILLESAPGAGSTFSVFFPRCEDVRGAWADAVEAAPLSRGSETILLVESDAQVRTLLAQIMTRSGYRVIDTASPGEALLAAEDHAVPIHLLLTDFQMPRLDGGQLAERLLRARPQLHVVFMSGSPDDGARSQSTLPAEVLQKPITPSHLVTALRRILDRRLQIPA